MPTSEQLYQAEVVLALEDAYAALQALDKRIIEGFEKSADKASKTFGQKLKGGLDAVSQYSLQATAGLAGIVAAAAQVESGLVGVAKTTGIERGTQEFSALKTELLDITKRVPVAASRIFEIAEAAGTVGVKGVDNIRNFTETIAKLDGATTDLKGAEAASTLKTILQLSGEGVENVDELASAIVVLGNNYNTTEGQAARLTLEIAKGLGAYEKSSNSLLALGGALAEVKISPELAKTNIGAIAATIQENVIEGGKSLDKLAKMAGKSTKEFKKLFEKDAGLAVAALSKGLKDLTSEERFKFFDEYGLKSKEVQSVFNALANQSQQFEMILSDVNDEYANATALNKEAAASGDTFSKKMVLVYNAVLRLGDALAGGGLLDSLKDLVDALASAIDVIAGFPQPVKTATVALLGLVALSGPLSKFVNIISKFGGLVGGITGLGTAAGGASTAVSGFGRAVSFLGRLTLVGVGVSVFAALASTLLDLSSNADKAAAATDKLKEINAGKLEEKKQELESENQKLLEQIKALQESNAPQQAIDALAKQQTEIADELKGVIEGKPIEDAIKQAIEARERLLSEIRQPVFSRREGGTLSQPTATAEQAQALAQIETTINAKEAELARIRTGDVSNATSNDNRQYNFGDINITSPNPSESGNQFVSTVKESFNVGAF